MDRDEKHRQVRWFPVEINAEENTIHARVMRNELALIHKDNSFKEFFCVGLQRNGEKFGENMNSGKDFASTHHGKIAELLLIVPGRVQ